jgi:hypothetical protein
MHWLKRLAFACASCALLLAVDISGVGSSASRDTQAQASQTEVQPPKAKTKAGAPANRNPAPPPKSTTRRDYVGDTVCENCHQEKASAYSKTAHHLTSQVATKQTIVGNFSPGFNTMATANPNLSFRMDVKGDAFYQTAIWASANEPATKSATSDSSSSPATGTHTRTERLDLVIGSGGKGQTYLFWRQDELFQLPVGYSTVLHQWINSPGYVDGTADFTRGIIPRCLECHATYFESILPGPEFNLYDTTNFVLGISCERCHGPGRKHAEIYASKAAAHPAATIVNPAKLSPARRADVCAQCHAGQGIREILPAFTYVPGQLLEKYIDLGPLDSNVDVHGKQGMLLAKSRCYQASADMNCSTCHDVHQPEPGLAAMSQHCLRCHKIESSPAHAKVGEALASNCIDCHMPTLESKVVYLDVNGKRIRPRFRTHWIKVYSEADRQ